ncbi:BZ3500_MvSof-1268-A1-R1_Chr2-1g04462 [Microbotryum saponariae]|uniref:BZ3500_MvSof-1268-A1-R1_Chr2-1g04462 protein n=1 Tax=Microbotryum saponariae TaxID=289078 RepID=A0A2X0KJB8_9BASI|nr:BZ3500_MvSof-1268-A1-R1_Chr2-1g04462 [Microbotryum saponariae]SCZ91778.1 BZ3501_MvSof-1269-A2-R1_Chr2-1g04118 [Microbotryum saponariae]
MYHGSISAEKIDESEGDAMMVLDRCTGWTVPTQAHAPCGDFVAAHCRAR